MILPSLVSPVLYHSISDEQKKFNGIWPQLNDTHPALAIPELMRILVDEEGVDWDTVRILLSLLYNYRVTLGHNQMYQLTVAK